MISVCIKNLPETYKGYQVEELFSVWQEIRSKAGTAAPREEIKTMSTFLRDYGLGLFGAAEMPDPTLKRSKKTGKLF